ncbi:MAG: phospho-sugar mutase [Oscillospiraceae bacterium]|nr:phospho-sugar mutase [Oscillospiraceae bacterium]
MGDKYILRGEKVWNDLNLISEPDTFGDDDTNKRFSTNLTFGTAGLRGVMGDDVDQINIYTIRLITQGLCNYLKKNKNKDLSVAIAFDSRRNSKTFAMEAARVFCANSIKVFFNKELQPTPVLSYCVRRFGCDAGVMVTASHNPPEYNGYKCYGPDGSQMVDFCTFQICQEIDKISICDGVKVIKESLDNSAFFKILNSKDYEPYVKAVKRQCPNADLLKNTDLSVVYTPLNGCGKYFVSRILSELGVKNFFMVHEQAEPDEDFKSCKIPNPELEEAFNLAVLLAKKENADIIIATDPDSDRLGVKVKSCGKYITVTGNQIAILFLDYLLTFRHKGPPGKGVVFKSITSTPMADTIAQKNFCRVINVLTGFKNIGEKILELEKSGREKDFIFAFEESCGYLLDTHVRDKDGVAAAVVVCEMAAYYKKINMTLIDKINLLYEKYGFFKEKTLNFEFNGENSASKADKVTSEIRNLSKEEFKEEGPISKGRKTMNKARNLSAGDLKKESPIFKVHEAMDRIRNLSAKELKEMGVSEKIDLLSGHLTDLAKCEKTCFLRKQLLDLPKSDVILFLLGGLGRIIVRPSGTEPKLKVYILLGGEVLRDVTDLMDKLKFWIESIILFD